MKTKVDHQAILKNRADVMMEKTRIPGEDANPDLDEIVFALRDSHHDFSMDLTTILCCLRLAEQEGGVPPLPETWWTSVSGRYTVPLL